MVSVFCKDLNYIKSKIIVNNQYSFLKSNNYDFNIIYDLLNSQLDHKIKNIYRFIYLRTNKLKKEFPKLNKLDNYKDNISPLLFNTFIDKYINNNILNEIIIVNSILLYFYPIS